MPPEVRSAEVAHVSAETSPHPPLRAHPSRQEMEAVGEKIAEVSVQVAVATHRLLTLIREFDAGNGWGMQGALTCAHWLTWRVGLSLGAAREYVRVAKALAELPEIDAAFAQGKVSYSKVRALTRAARPATEKELLDVARTTTGAQLEKLMGAYARGVDAAEKTPGEHREDEDRRSVRCYPDGNGMMRIVAVVRVEEADIIMRALDAGREAIGAGEKVDVSAETSASLRSPESEDGVTGRGAVDVSAETRDVEERDAERGARELEDEIDELADILGDVADDPEVRDAEEAAQRRAREAARQMEEEEDEESANAAGGFNRRVSAAERGRWGSQADALVLLAESFLAGRRGQRNGGARTVMTVHVDSAVLSGARKDGLSELDDGTRLAPETVRRLACDASVVRIVEDADGMPLDVGRKTRTIPPALRRALEARDRGCRFPGCTNRLFVDAHHVHHWADGGETSLKNAISLCGRHHSLVHEGGYRIEVGVDGAITFRAPSGMKLESVPPMPDLDPEMLAALEEEHGIAKLELSGDHLRPIDYAPMNLDYAVSSLLNAGGVLR